MDGHKQPAPNNEPQQRTKVWQPQSRIAGYIKGSVKLEEMMSREKLVRPEQRHNRRVIKALINDDDEPVSATFVRSKNRSAISRCPSSSTRTSTSLSRASSVPPHQQLTADDLTRTIVEKNEHITALRDQLEAVRNCARLELPEGGGSLHVVLERMLECLLNMATNLRHPDEHDERMLQFVAAVKSERESVLRTVDALCQINARKDEELHQMSKTQAQMSIHLRKLRQGKDGSSSEERHLLQRLRIYEEKYKTAAAELCNLSMLVESVRKHIYAEKEAFDERAKKHNKNIDDLHLSYRSLGEKKKEAEKRLAQLEKTHADEMAQLRKQKEESEAFVQRLEIEVRQMKIAEQKLRTENAALVERWDKANQENKRKRDEIKCLKKEKEALMTGSADIGMSDRDNPTRETVETEKMTSFAEQESQWNRLKRCLHKTVVRAGILPDDDVR